MDLVAALRWCAIKPRALVTTAALVLGGLGAALPVPAAAAGTIWNVQAGAVNASPPDLPSTEITGFYPANITLHQGDQVVFTAVGGHTVTFNAPPLFGFAFGGLPGLPPPFFGTTLTVANQDGGAPLNSGAIGSGGPGGSGPPTYTLTVDAPPATYHFTCRFHRQMAGSITVVPDAQALPSTDAENQVAAQASINADIGLGTEILNDSEGNGDEVTSGVGATSTTGFGAVAVLRFAPSTISVQAGQTVTFVNDDINTPHTVTFGPEQPPPPGTPPMAPPGFLPYGSTTISDPSQSSNSGFLISQDLVNYLNAGFFFGPPAPAPHTVASFTFTTPGVYHYICALHDQLGMVGTVVVEAE